MSDDSSPLYECPLGTVIRTEWDDEYKELVEQTERKAKRAVCGSPKKDGDPCLGHPDEKYGYFCNKHKHTGELQLMSAQTNKPVTGGKIYPPLLVNDEIRNALAQCTHCHLKRRCAEYLPEHYCQIEERIVLRFVDDAKSNYDVTSLDEYSIIMAALTFAAMFRARLAQSNMTPQEAEQSKLSWQAPREAK